MKRHTGKVHYIRPQYISNHLASYYEKIKNINIMVVKCVSFLDEDQINIIPETCSKPTVNKGMTI